MSFDLEEFLKKYNVHPEAESYLRKRQAQGGKNYMELGPVEARLDSIQRAQEYGGTTEFTGTDTEFIVPSPDCKDGIPVSVYRPTSCDGTPAPSIVVYFHGGGNVLGCRKSHETVCKIIAREANCIVVNVEYRLAPEHKFPANHDDAKCAVQWVASNKAKIGGSEQSKIGVAGDSAGGKLAATVCHEEHELIQFAVLVYPSVDLTTTYPSFVEFDNGPILPRPVRRWFMSNYLNNSKDKESTRSSPIMNTDFSYLPPTLLIVAELDPLKDGCYEYYKKLKAAGVKSDVITIKGVPHAFWSLAAHYKDTCKEAHEAAVKFIKAQ